MNRALVIGNGQSRKWYCPSHQTIMTPVVTWGCNAIYRDGTVDYLVAVDYGMQQEIYDSEYDSPCHFSNWSIVPSAVADMMFMGFDIPEGLIHYSKKRTENCVIQGKDPNTLQEKVEAAIQMNPHLSISDLKLKMEKDVGVWITYVEENDIVENIDYPVGWSTGNTALHLACQAHPQEVYILGFDLSSYDKRLNNIYKGTDNYLPADTKGFSPDNWYHQMRAVFEEFSEIKFYLTNHDNEGFLDIKNLEYITKNDLCERLQIV